MRKVDGLKLSLVDENKLASSGILVGTGGTSPLSEAASKLFLTIAAAGELGLAKSKVPSALKPDFAEALLQLELLQLVTTERDNRGKPSYLVLTWKGYDALDAARSPKKKVPSIATQRRASITDLGLF